MFRLRFIYAYITMAVQSKRNLFRDWNIPYRFWSAKIMCCMIGIIVSFCETKNIMLAICTEHKKHVQL